MPPASDSIHTSSNDRLCSLSSRTSSTTTTTMTSTMSESSSSSSSNMNTGSKSKFHSAGLRLAIIFSMSLMCLFLVYWNFPNLEPSEKPDFKLPMSYEEAKRLGTILLRYTDRYYFTVLSGILVTYVL